MPTTAHDQLAALNRLITVIGPHKRFYRDRLVWLDDRVIVRGVNLSPSAVDAAVRTVDGVREYPVGIDRRPTLPEVLPVFEFQARRRHILN